jgi:hypothetical protein
LGNVEDVDKRHDHGYGSLLFLRHRPSS